MVAGAFCPQCGKPTEVTPFCRFCGASLTSAPAAPPSQPPPAPVAPPPPQPAAPQPPPPPPPRASGRFVLGVVGGVLAVGVLALVFFLAAHRTTSAAPLPPEPSAPGTTTAVTTTTTAPTITTSPTPTPAPNPTPAPTPHPASSRLRKLIQNHVGPFALRQVARAPDLIKGDVADAYLCSYAGNGVSLTLLAQSYTKAAHARGDVGGLAKYLVQNKGYTQNRTFKVKDTKGRVLGIAADLSKGSERDLIWSNDVNEFWVSGPDPNPMTFYDKNPY